MLKFKAIAYTLLISPCFTFGIVRADTVQSPITVSVNAKTVKGGVRYDYQIINRSTAPLASLIIGFGDSNGESELKTPPKGWTISTGIPATSVSSPAGWTAEIISTEESDLLQLQWEISNSSNSLRPGKSLQGFSVMVPKNDLTYQTSHWTVYASSGPKASYTGKLQAVRALEN
jgi:hypothetical protein